MNSISTTTALGHRAPRKLRVSFLFVILFATGSLSFTGTVEAGTLVVAASESIQAAIDGAETAREEPARKRRKVDDAVEDQEDPIETEAV